MHIGATVSTKWTHLTNLQQTSAGQQLTLVILHMLLIQTNIRLRIVYQM
uniref:Uncharacterized protein n=1 Tax=Arundo donax TaxID=35708 RepID=A0A0A9EE39_ARUDO